jgi:hypothetical protein
MKRACGRSSTLMSHHRMRDGLRREVKAVLSGARSGAAHAT